MPDFATDIITAIGGRPTPSSLAAVRGWQQREGGATNNSASFNWLNRTDKGYPTINKVGVVAYPDYQTGINRTAELIKSGYPSIAQGLRTGSVDFSNPMIQGDFNRWVSGKRQPGMTPYVSGVAKAAGQNPGPLSTPAQGVPQGAPVAPAPAQQPQMQNVAPMLMAAAQNRDQQSQTAQLIGALQSAGAHGQAQNLAVARGTLAATAVMSHPEAQAAGPVGGAIAFAQSQRGVPYVFGAATKGKAFDCSGLIQAAYAAAGVKIGRDTAHQIQEGVQVDASQIQPGDLVFPTNHHVVMYIGNGQVVAAPHTGTVVQNQPLASFMGKNTQIRRIVQ